MKAHVLLTALGLSGIDVGIGQITAVGGTSAAETERSTLRSPANDLDHLAPGEAARDRFATQPLHAGSGTGANIAYSDIHQTLHFTLDSSDPDYDPTDPIHAYALGSRTCNIGDEPLLWAFNGTPGFASNFYRLHDGRLMQIGTSCVKHACCVVNDTNVPLCGSTCGSGPANTLRPGCLDVYSATWNANQSRMGPRTRINPYTGQFAPISSGTFNAIERRLQVRQSDMTLMDFPGSLFFVEGVYVCTDTAQAGNWHNNATYRRVTVNQSSYELSLATQQSVGLPAIYAWKEHGNGVDQPDEDVEIVIVDHPDEGRFFAAAKVTDNGDGTWHYEYAVYNLNSELAVGGFSVDLGEWVTVRNVGFHAPRYHSGEEQDNTPWPHELADGRITWSTPETFAENANSSAIRWGAMHNFWFDADAPPESREVELHTFKPHNVESLPLTLAGPSDGINPCPADLTGSGRVDGGDLLVLLGQWGDCSGCGADLNGDGVVNLDDLVILLSEWGDCP